MDYKVILASLAIPTLKWILKGISKASALLVQAIEKLEASSAKGVKQ